MTEIDIISGFLGAGKTTLIKKLIKEGLPEDVEKDDETLVQKETDAAVKRVDELIAAKEKEILLNNYEEDLERIGGIQNNLGDYYKNGINMKKDYVNTVNSITGEDIQKMLKELYEQKNIFETVLMPAR